MDQHLTRDAFDQKANISETILHTLEPLTLEGKCGKSLLQPSIANALQKAGYIVDIEDVAGFLVGGAPAWRCKDTQEVVPTSTRRRIDIVVYKDDNPVALIETESDLNDLREHGVSRRRGHYDVYSIARDGNGNWFNSYKSLERMASAAFLFGRPESSSSSLQNLRSDSPSDHNPASLPMFLVTGSCRPRDPGILAPRIKALGATLICGSTGQVLE